MRRVITLSASVNLIWWGENPAYATYHYERSTPPLGAICKCCGVLEGTDGAYCTTCRCWSCEACVTYHTNDLHMNTVTENECVDCMVGD